MAIEYYAFALFITAMICLIAILFRLLFADVKKQKKLLDEKEKELLQLYRTVENVMEEFADHVKAVTEDIQKHEDKLAKLAETPPLPPPPSVAYIPTAQMQNPETPPKPEPMEKLPRSMTIDASAERIKVAGEVIERAGRVIQGDLARVPPPPKSTPKPAFKSFFDESTVVMQAIDPETAEKQKRNELIQKLAKEGKTTVQIAQEMGITQNEVKLIVKLGTG